MKKFQRISRGFQKFSKVPVACSVPWPIFAKSSILDVWLKFSLCHWIYMKIPVVEFFFQRKFSFFKESCQLLACIFTKSRSSRSQMFFKIGTFKNLANFTGKYLCWSLFLIKLLFLVKQESFPLKFLFTVLM